MSKRYLVRDIELDDQTSCDYLFIYSVGFETRSRFIAEKHIFTADNTLAVVYQYGRTLAFEENLAFAQSRGVPLVDEDREVLEKRIQGAVAEYRARIGALSVAVDVSAMNRSVMASVLISVFDLMVPGDIVKILYSPAKYVEPKLEFLPINRVGAVHPRISGQVGDPHNRRSLFLGLGYEYGVSLNVLDSIEPDMSFILRPHGFDERFSASVVNANFRFDFGERDYEVMDYHISDMSSLYDELSSLVVAMKHNTSIVSVPLGPKILSAIMILIGYIHQPHLSVVRYSLASWNYHHNVEADGMVVGFEINNIG